MKKLFGILALSMLISAGSFAAELNCSIAYEGSVTKAFDKGDIKEVSAEEVSGCPKSISLNFNGDDIKEAVVISNLMLAVTKPKAVCIYNMPRLASHEAFATIKCNK